MEVLDEVESLKSTSRELFGRLFMLFLTSLLGHEEKTEEVHSIIPRTWSIIAHTLSSVYSRQEMDV